MGGQNGQTVEESHASTSSRLTGADETGLGVLGDLRLHLVGLRTRNTPVVMVDWLVVILVKA